MVPSVTTVLQRCKTDWAAQLQPDAIHTACQKAGYTSWRDRLLNPVTTVQPSPWFPLHICGMKPTVF